MAASTKVKEAVAQLVRALGAGRVERGLLRYPTETNSYGLGATDLDYVLSRFIGQELILILMPLNARTEAHQTSNHMQEEET